jgi:hypothetical protein
VHGLYLRAEDVEQERTREKRASEKVDGLV